ncbi:MAG: hypothetical protein ACK4SY_07075 [Pyrobaculum sp.]
MTVYNLEEIDSQFDELLKRFDRYGILTLYGGPGVGKTALGFNVLAWHVYKSGRVTDWDEARRYVYRHYFYMPSSISEAVQHFAKVAKRGKLYEFLFMDDANITYQLEPKAWPKLIEQIKLARGAIAERGMIFTTFNRHYISKRLWNVLNTHLVEREGDVVRVYKLMSTLKVDQEYLKSKLGSYAWNVFKVRLVGEFPITPELALPLDVEAALMKKRREVVSSLGKVGEGEPYLVRRKWKWKWRQLCGKIPADLNELHECVCDKRLAKELYKYLYAKTYPIYRHSDAVFRAMEYGLDPDVLPDKPSYVDLLKYLKEALCRGDESL